MDHQVDSTTKESLLDIDDDMQKDDGSVDNDFDQLTDELTGGGRNEDDDVPDPCDTVLPEPTSTDKEADKDQLVSSSQTGNVSQNLLDFEAGDVLVESVLEPQTAMDQNSEIPSSTPSEEKISGDMLETGEATPTPSAPSTPVVEVPKHDLKPVLVESSLDDQPVRMPKQATTTVPCKTKSCNSCSYFSCIGPSVYNLLLWRNPVLTGCVLGVELVILLSLTCCSVFSVVSYTLLLALIGVFGARLYKYVMGRVHSGDDTHPLKFLLDLDVTVTDQKAMEYGVMVAQELNCCAVTLRDLVLVKDVIPSLKFGLILYAFTYVGACFNGLTLLILAVVGVFTLPKIYAVNKVQIDRYVEAAQAKFDDIYRQLQDKIPYLKKQKTQ